MPDNVRVRSLSVFFGSDEGRVIAVGDEFEVSSARAADLARNGLVEPLKPPKAEPPVDPPPVNRGRGRG